MLIGPTPQWILLTLIFGTKERLGKSGLVPQRLMNLKSMRYLPVFHKYIKDILEKAAEGASFHFSALWYVFFMSYRSLIFEDSKLTVMWHTGAGITIAVVFRDDGYEWKADELFSITNLKTPPTLNHWNINLKEKCKRENPLSLS